MDRRKKAFSRAHNVQNRNEFNLSLHKMDRYVLHGFRRWEYVGWCSLGRCQDHQAQETMALLWQIFITIWCSYILIENDDDHVQNNKTVKQCVLVSITPQNYSSSAWSSLIILFHIQMTKVTLTIQNSYVSLFTFSFFLNGVYSAPNYMPSNTLYYLQP